MSRVPRVVVVLLLAAAVALAAPGLANGQAKSRGSSGGAKSAGPARSAAPVRQTAPAKPASRPSAVRPATPAPRPAVARPAPSQPSVATGRDRGRGTQPVVGSATPRGARRQPPIVYIPVPIYTGLGWFTPWYGFGYDSFYGFGGGYRGYPLGRSWLGYGSVYSGSVGRGSASTGGRTGSIRLRVNPGTAKVYIDGALVGIVADFDGLTEHLELAGGAYQLELRADGYETYRVEIHVSVGKTTTERVTLKKKQ